MTTPDQNPFPKLELFHPLKALGHLLLEGCSMHQLSPISDHKFAANHLDEVADQPAVDWSNAPS